MTSEWDFAIKKYAIRDLTFEDVKEMVNKASDYCVEPYKTSRGPVDICYTDTFLIAFKDVAVAYLTVYGIDVTLEDTERALKLCFENERCSFTYRGKKLCDKYCFNELFAEIVYEKFKKAGAKKFTEEGEVVLGGIEDVEHSDYGDRVKKALGIPITLNVSKECATKKFNCDAYGIKIKIICNIFYNIASGISEDEAESRAIEKVIDECGREKVFEYVFKKIN